MYETNSIGTSNNAKPNEVFAGINNDSIWNLCFLIPIIFTPMKIAIDNSDAIIRASEELPQELDTYINDLTKPVLDFYSLEEFADPYTEFYTNTVLNS